MSLGLAGLGVGNAMHFGEVAGREAMPRAILSADDYGEGDAIIVRERHFPAITVTEVFEDYCLDIETLLLRLGCSHLREDGSCEQEAEGCE